MIVSVIGRGGMGEVYLAEDPRLGRQVAVKVLTSRAEAGETGRERFRNEAQMAARLDHPNICTLHEIGTEGDVDYLVMPRLHGETLADRLARGTMERGGLDIALQLTEALDYAHAHGVIHRDIKPQNVMVTPEGRVKLMDFGLAKAPGRLDGVDETRAALTAPGVFFGTLQYMSPEQLEGGAADERSDIFSLGMILYQVFAAKHPFAGATAAATITAITSRPAPRLSETAPDAPAGLDRIIAKALARDPEERYQSTADLLAELRDVQRGAFAAPVRAGSSPREHRPFGRGGTIAAAVLLVAVAAAAAYLWLSAAAPPATSTEAPVAPLYSMTTWLEIRPSRAGLPQPAYESAAAVAVANGWGVKVHVTPAGAGIVTVLSDETVLQTDRSVLTLLHPSTTTAGETVATDWNEIGGPPSDIAIWVIWSATAVQLLEDLTVFDNPADRGIVRDPQAARGIREWLGARVSRGTASIADGATRLTRQGTERELVHRFDVKH